MYTSLYLCCSTLIHIYKQTYVYAVFQDHQRDTPQMNHIVKSYVQLTTTSSKTFESMLHTDSCDKTTSSNAIH